MIAIPVLVIPTTLLDRIKEAAETAWPEECCGLLGGLRKPDGAIAVTRMAASRNVAEGDTRERFEVDPIVRFELMRELRHGPESIVGHYHSHPDHPGRPSEHDLEMAFEPDLVWLIVAVDAGRATGTTAWVANTGTGADGFDAVEIVTEET